MRYVSLIVVAAATGFAQAQTGTIDQSSPHSNGANSAQFNAVVNFLIWQQQIRPTMTGQLEGIRITTTSTVPNATFRLALRHGAANSTNPVLFETTVTHANIGLQTLFIDMQSANYTQTSGQPFVMEVNGLSNGGNDPWILGSYIAPGSGDPLYPEPLFLNGSEFVPGWKLGFDTFVITGGDCSADFNNDDVVDFFDYLDFVSAFAAEDPSADFNDDGSIDFFDYLDFVQAFAEGC